MPVLQVHAEFDSDSGLPEDKCVNTFHFNAAAASGYDALMDAIETFYEDVRGSGNALKDYLSALLAGTYTIKVYNLADTPPRDPVASRAASYTVTGTTALPRECAVCLSYHADLVGQPNPERRRGRLYFGPLITGANQGAGPATGRPHADLISDLVEAGEALADEAIVISKPWAVYSRVDSTARNIVGGWVDDAFDTQRRRGDAASSRTTWTV